MVIVFCGVGLALMVLLWPAAVLAQPARIILLRHAEKLNHRELCEVGEQRAEALAQQYLGQGATQSLFSSGEKPNAFLAITAHTIETITPAAESWDIPVTVYKLHGKHEDGGEKEEELTRRTQEAGRDVLNDPRYDGKTIVIAWEHNHIAKAKLEKDNPGEEVTFRQLLGLDRVSDVPETWPDSNYDYFWIADYVPGNPVPVRFQMVRQVFTAPFAGLPANAWDEPEPEHLDAGCKK